MSVALAPKAEESSEHNLKSVVLWGVWGARTCLSVYMDRKQTLVDPTCRLQGGLFPRSCSSKGEKTENLEN